jgi:hypothetical protein
MWWLVLGTPADTTHRHPNDRFDNRSRRHRVIILAVVILLVVVWAVKDDRHR